MNIQEISVGDKVVYRIFGKDEILTVETVHYVLNIVEGKGEQSNMMLTFFSDELKPNIEGEMPKSGCLINLPTLIVFFSS